MAAKRVLVLYHSYSGQTQRAVFKVKDALESEGHSVDMRRVRPENPWKRPVSRTTFLLRNAKDWLGFDMAMPIRPIDLNPDDYDHVVIGTQTWHLGPAYPMLYLMNSDFAEVFKGKSVSLVMTCRNRYKPVVEIVEEKVTGRGGRLGAVFVLSNKPDHLRPTLFQIFNDRDPLPGEFFHGRTGRKFAFTEEEMDNASVWGKGLADMLSQDTLPQSTTMTVINDQQG